MKRIFVWLIILTFVCVPVSEAARDPNHVTMWNRVTDFFATLGKSGSEKKSILEQRKAERAEERAADFHQKELEENHKKMLEQNQKIMGGIHTRSIPHGAEGIDAP